MSKTIDSDFEYTIPKCLFTFHFEITLTIDKHNQQTINSKIALRTTRFIIFVFITRVMSTSRICKSFIFKDPCKGLPTLSNFKLTEQKLCPLKNNEYLAEAVYIRATPHPAAADVMKLNTVPKAIQLAKVIESKNENISVGRYVIGNFGWQTHTIIDLGTQAYLLPKLSNLSPTLNVGLLGIPGIAAYFGFLEICKPRENDVVVISSAAGAVGSCVGQIAKIKGCKVIGITSSNEKCSWLKEIGFDYCINYKTDNIKKQLEEYAPNGVDCYFDNVGGEISSYVIYQMNTHGRICICGATALYYNDEIRVHEVQSPIKIKTAIMEGMQVTRWKDQWDSAIKQIAQWINEKKLQSKDTIIDGFDSVPHTFINTLEGKYFGNVVVKV